MSVTSPLRLFKYRHFEPQIILLCLRWYLRYSLSYRDDGGAGAIRRSYYHLQMGSALRLRRYAPMLEKRCRAKLKPTNDSWRVDETYIKVKGQWMYLYAPVPGSGLCW